MTPLRVLPVLALVVAGASWAGAQATLRPAPSGRATSEVSLSVPRPAPMAGMPGMAAAPEPKPLLIHLDYGQPHLRGRALHTDSLVPYEKAWRTGASASTTLTTDVDLVVGGATLTKGTYVLFSLPSRGTWKLIVQRSVGQSAMQYADSNDVTRIDLRHTTLPAPLESFTMWLIPSAGAGPAHGELRFAWGTDQLAADWSIK